MWSLVILLVNCLLVQSRDYYEYNLDEAEDHFEDFIARYNKDYDEYERHLRFVIFQENLKEINKKNQESDHAVYAVNKFSDLTEMEFLHYYTGLKGWVGKGTCTAEAKLSGKAPESFDWRSMKVVSRVKDQKQCGSCWAFGTSGAVESQYAIKHKTIQEISEQQLVDCDKQSQGCSGTNDLEYPYSYLISKGAMAEKDYPYKGIDGNCQYDAGKVKVKVTGCRSPSLNQDEEKMKNILHQYGPATIAVDAEILSFYRSGIIKDTQCKTKTVNHAVLLVGYGSENGTPYWIVKNSWGESFGEKGYFRIQGGVNCLNFMLVDPIQPVVA